MRRTILLFSVFALLLASCGGGGNGHYEGQAVSFDYPNGWQEYPWAAPPAYAPVSGGDGEFVLIVIPAPPETKGMTLEDFAKWPSSDLRLSGPAETVDVNGLRGYLVPVALTGPNGEAFDLRFILVKGERDDYLIMCQYGRHVEAEVLAGCEMVSDTLVETPRGQ